MSDWSVAIVGGTISSVVGGLILIHLTQSAPTQPGATQSMPMQPPAIQSAPTQPPGPETISPSRPVELPLPSPPWNHTNWSHNGSVMYLVADGSKREFRYDNPREGLLNEGVRPGTRLFFGTASGNTWKGTAYLFSGQCQMKFEYTVRGEVSASGDRVEMRGNAPVTRDCLIIGERGDRLVFTRIPNVYPPNRDQ
jgi:hypothetical protein